MVCPLFAEEWGLHLYHRPHRDPVWVKKRLTQRWTDRWSEQSPPARGSPADLSAGITQTTHTHSHSAPGTWRGHCCSMCSRMASAPGCPGHRCCLQTGWASRWGPRSSPWLHGAAPSRGALPHSRWPLQVRSRNKRHQGAQDTKVATPPQEQNQDSAAAFSKPSSKSRSTDSFYFSLGKES